MSNVRWVSMLLRAETCHERRRDGSFLRDVVHHVHGIEVRTRQRDELLVRRMRQIHLAAGSVLKRDPEAVRVALIAGILAGSAANAFSISAIFSGVVPSLNLKSTTWRRLPMCV